MFVEQGRAAIVEEEMPVCGSDTVLLRTLYSGVSLGTERMFLVGGNYGGNSPYLHSVSQRGHRGTQIGGEERKGVRRG
jgi:hypothetical protein